MKKLLVMMCVGLLTLGLVACGGEDNAQGSQSSEQQSSEQQSSESSQPAETPEESQSGESEEAPLGTVVNGHDYLEGWTEEMNPIRTAVVEDQGENYWATMPLTPDLLEMQLGITPDMYDDYIAEMPAMSAHVDMLVVIKAKEGQVAAVEEILNAYRDNNVNNSMQYPMNMGKVQASKVETIGNYVCFVQLGGDTMAAEENGEEAVIEHCRQVNDRVIEIINQNIQK